MILVRDEYGDLYSRSESTPWIPSAQELFAISNIGVYNKIKSNYQVARHVCFHLLCRDRYADYTKTMLLLNITSKGCMEFLFVRSLITDNLAFTVIT